MKVAEGFISVAKHCKYRGSYSTYNLRDDFGINARITAASKPMGALKNFWDNPHVDMRSKFLIFRAVPINLLLWGYKTWVMRGDPMNKIEVFLNHGCRRI